MAINMGVIGDSGVDAFRGTDNRGGSYASVTYNPIEILAILRPNDFNFGAWGAYSEPRRTDYAYNYSRSAATSRTMITGGQHTGLAGQISANVQYAFIRIGANDFAAGYASDYEAVYNGTLNGAALTSRINQSITDLQTAVEALQGAGATGVVSQLFPRTPDAQAVAAGWTNATYRQRVTDAIASINSGLATMYASHSVPYTDPNGIQNEIWFTSGSTASGFEYWGQWIDAASVGDSPLHLILADGVHAGTVLNAIQANYNIIAPLNTTYGLGIKPIKPWEILTLCNLSGGISGRLVRA
jgi:hypothetical protein